MHHRAALFHGEMRRHVCRLLGEASPITIALGRSLAHATYAREDVNLEARRNRGVKRPGLRADGECVRRWSSQKDEAKLCSNLWRRPRSEPRSLSLAEAAGI